MDHSKIKLSALIRNISCQTNKSLISELYDIKDTQGTQYTRDTDETRTRPLLDRPHQKTIPITKVKPIISGPPLPIDNITAKPRKPHKKRHQISA